MWKLALGLACLLAPLSARAGPAEPELTPLSPSDAPPRPRREPPRPARLDAHPPHSPDPDAPIRRTEKVEKEEKIEAIAPAPARDEERDRIRLGPARRPWIIARTRAWFAQDSVVTRYSVQVPPSSVNPPGNVYLGETEERAVDGILLLHSVEIAPLTWFSGEFEFGEDKPDGRYTDRYWVNAPDIDVLTKVSNGATWNKPDHEDDLVFSAAHAARRDWTAASVYFRIFEGHVAGDDDSELRHAFDVAIGAHRFRQDSRFSNLERIRSDGKLYTANPLGPIPGFSGTYSAMWRGPHLGLREEMSLPIGFSFDMLVLYSPFMEFRGDGYNNLAGGLRPNTPNYEDRCHGSAYHFRIGAAWTWGPARIEGGYMRLYFTSHKGLRRYYNSNGTIFDQPLELTETEIAGGYVGASLRF